MGAMIGPWADPAISAPVSTSVTTRPSARVNMDRCERSQRAKASLMALARSMKVCAGPTAKMRPGHGHSSSPRPPSSSTVTDNQVRAIPQGWHAPTLPQSRECRPGRRASRTEVSVPRDG